MVKKNGYKAIRQLICFLLLMVLTAGCSSNNENSSFDYGQIKNGIYQNNYFNLAMEIPEEWIVQSKKQAERLSKMGEKLLTGDDEKLKAIIEADDIESANLLTLFRYELGAAVKYNPNLIIVADNLKNTPGIKTGKDSLFHLRQLLSIGQLKYDYLSDEFEQVIIGRKEFYKMNTMLKVMDIEIQQVVYATVLKGFGLTIIISYISEDEKNILHQAIDTIDFAK